MIIFATVDLLGVKVKVVKMVKPQLQKKFGSMPNFRVVGGSEEQLGVEKLAPNLYRSSRPDLLNENDLEEFGKLGIRTILDFRSVREYTKANGQKLLDSIYPVFKIKLPFLSLYKPGQKVNYVPVDTMTPKQAVPEEVMRSTPDNSRHFLLDFFKANYIWAVFNRAPLWFRFFSLIYVIIDLVLQTEWRYFVGAFAKKVLNQTGLVGQYKDMINYSQASIYAALKLLSEQENLPAMINCAHGKDRTGLVSAMVLACLGRTKEEIATDYARSAMELESIKDHVRKEIVEKFDMCPTFATAKYETMMEALDYIDENWGSIPNYLEAIGFGRADQEKLAASMLAYAED